MNHRPGSVLQPVGPEFLIVLLHVELKTRCGDVHLASLWLNIRSDTLLPAMNHSPACLVMLSQI